MYNSWYNDTGFFSKQFLYEFQPEEKLLKSEKRWEFLGVISRVRNYNKKNRFSPFVHWLQKVVISNLCFSIKYITTLQKRALLEPYSFLTIEPCLVFSLLIRISSFKSLKVLLAMRRLWCGLWIAKKVNFTSWKIAEKVSTIVPHTRRVVCEGKIHVQPYNSYGSYLLVSKLCKEPWNGAACDWLYIDHL